MGEQAQIMCRTVWNALRAIWRQRGLSNCSVCPTGQYQPSEGEQRCKECVDLAAYKTNRTGAHRLRGQRRSLGRSVVEMLFKNYTAYYVTVHRGICYGVQRNVTTSVGAIHIHSSTGDDLGHLAVAMLYKSHYLASALGASHADDRDLLRK